MYNTNHQLLNITHQRRHPPPPSPNIDCKEHHLRDLTTPAKDHSNQYQATATCLPTCSPTYATTWIWTRIKPRWCRASYTSDIVQTID
jgi:hypothetical protein